MGASSLSPGFLQRSRRCPRGCTAIFLRSLGHWGHLAGGQLPRVFLYNRSLCSTDAVFSLPQGQRMAPLFPLPDCGSIAQLPPQRVPFPVLLEFLRIYGTDLNPDTRLPRTRHVWVLVPLHDQVAPIPRWPSFRKRSRANGSAAFYSDRLFASARRTSKMITPTLFPWSPTWGSLGPCPPFGVPVREAHENLPPLFPIGLAAAYFLRVHPRKSGLIALTPSGAFHFLRRLFTCASLCINRPPVHRSKGTGFLSTAQSLTAAFTAWQVGGRLHGGAPPSSPPPYDPSRGA